jgi:hypothetical protein
MNWWHDGLMLRSALLLEQHVAAQQVNAERPQSPHYFGHHGPHALAGRCRLKLRARVPSGKTIEPYAPTCRPQTFSDDIPLNVPL